jgi:membrane protease YdiL (CAAX protease family)
MDYGKKDAVRVANVLGCAALFSMLLGLLLLLAEKKNPWSGAESLIAVNVVSLAVFVLPAVWGVRKIRHTEIVFSPAPVKADLNKKLAVTLSTFGTIMIIRILYAAVFPSAVETFGVSAEMTATELFLVFVFSTIALAAAEEIFFRGFFLRAMRIFRASLAVLMSALAFALMRFSVEGFPLYFVAGLLIGMAYVATNSLATAVGTSFLCKAFLFLEETVSVYLPDGYMLLMQSGLFFCVVLSASGLPYLKENMRAFFENDDENAIPSSYFWTVPTVAFVVLAAGLQFLLPLK